jgi:hypothetical protein
MLPGLRRGLPLVLLRLAPEVLPHPGGRPVTQETRTRRHQRLEQDETEGGEQPLNLFVANMQQR